MKFQDLKKFDVASVDTKKVLAAVEARKDILAQVVVVVVAVVSGMSLFGNYNTEVALIQARMGEIRTKLEKGKSLAKVKEDVDVYLKTLPQELDEEQFSLRLAELAAQHNISIVSINPGIKNSEAFSYTSTTKVDAEAQSFKDLLLFLKAVEESPFALRIDACEFSIQQGMASLDRQQGDVYRAVLDMTSVGIRK